MLYLSRTGFCVILNTFSYAVVNASTKLLSTWYYFVVTLFPTYPVHFFTFCAQHNCVLNGDLSMSWFL